MPRVRDLLEQAARVLPGAESRREAALLLRHVLGVADAWLIAHADDAIDAGRAAIFHALIARRARGEPVAYLTGTRGFHALELQVTPDVLIPRPETELLVELALARIPRSPDEAQRNPDYRIADLGTGSGAIALAIAQARPNARVLATDASKAALEIARENARRSNLANVGFALGDWCAALGDYCDFDLIVSNPPYIADRDPHLREGDLRFEPRAALASGADGLDAIRTIVRDARAHLREGGWLLLEHGFEQGAQVRALLEQSGYRDAFTERDLEGRERVSGGKVP
ncbi:MAG TPA: peptide chain release factor N(5)-glutamine methyltransferase [Rhodanobacteraceae bacterium]|nr:peptide chain release factor N(5)-glutamine methyltransferase [Rhodanobacteraceae bacterium]